MKILKLSIIVILAGLLLSGCEKKKEGIELVPNLDKIYMSPDMVYFPNKEPEDIYKKINKDIIDAIKSLHGESLKETLPLPNQENNIKPSILYRISLRLYINENGKIDKVKDIEGNVSDFLEKGETVYIDRKKLDEALIAKMENWQLEPGTYKGQKVKYWEDFKINVTMNPDGTYNVENRNYFSSIPNPDTFVPVDKYPQIVKSAVPIYPELAKRAGVEGNVYVKVFVDKEGKPIKTIIIKSDDKIFNQVSIDAAMKFEFTPAIKNNEPVGVWVVIPFKFKLDGSKGELKKHKDLKKMPTPKDSN